MKPEKIFEFGENAEKINVDERYVTFNHSGYDSQTVSLSDAAYTLGENTIGGVVSALGLLREKLRDPLEEAAERLQSYYHRKKPDYTV